MALIDQRVAINRGQARKISNARAQYLLRRAYDVRLT
jgi:hypothetical protein